MVVRSPVTALISSILALACTPATAAAQTAEDIASLDAELDRAIAESRTKAHALLANEAAALTLPVADHLSTLRYCALFTRVTPASDEAAAAGLRARAAMRRAAEPPTKATVDTIPFDSLFPLVRDQLSFDREPSVATTGALGRTYMASDVGLCAVLTLDDPAAQARTKAWLETPGSGWLSKGKSRGWKIYQVRNPSLTEQSLVLLEAPLSKKARALGVTAVHLVGVTGLP